jgi:glutathione S-transferase
MTDTLHFYTNPMSRGRIVRWMLEEVGQPYETTLFDYGAAMKSPAYKAINPMGKVPALVHGNTVVTECAAICAYLAETFPQAGLLPAPEARGDYYRWLFYAAGPVEAAVTNRALKVEIPEERRGMVGYGSFAQVMDTLEWAVTGKRYIAGDHFTAADVYFGSQIGWGLQFGTIEKRPAFETYWNGLKDRPAAMRARAIDDALIPKR